MTVFLCLFLLTAVLFPACALAAENGEDRVRVGYYENEVFQEGAEEGAVKSGYAYEYYRKLSEYTGWKYEYVYGSFGDLYQMFLDGDVDLLAGLAYREERAELIGYPEAIMGSESYYLVKHDTKTDITPEPSTLNGKRIGVLDSVMVGVLENYLEAHGTKAEVIPYPDHEDMFKAFDSGELDVYVAESNGAYGREHAEVLCAFGSSDYYLCVAKDRPDLLEELNTAQTLLQAEEPNFLNSLSAKYYSVSVTARAFSAAEREWMESHDTLRVGYLQNYLPYSDTDDQGQATGMVKDIIPEILKGLGIPELSVIYTGYKSYDSMLEDLNTGAIDVAFPVGGGLYYSEENGINQSNPVASASTEIVLKGTYNEETISKFAVNENNRMQYYYVRTNFPDAEIAFYPSIDKCLEAVLSGEVTCSTLNGLRANDILKNSKYKGLSLHQTNKDDDRCFGVEIGNDGLLKLLNRGINVIGSDYAQNLSYRYTGGLYSYGVRDLLRDNMALVASVILGIAALIIFLVSRDLQRTKKEAAAKEAARIELEEKNRELAESKEALSDALVAAEHASRAKTTFLNNMSHDIRTPMNAIVGFTALASSHINNKEQVQDYLGKISVSSQHLLSLINDVLDMSRIESGNVTIEMTDVHLPDIIHDLGTIIRSSAEDKDQELTIDTRELVHEDIVTDKLRLNQVLLNILSNAVKFTPEGGKISFSVTERPSSPETSEYEFRISDNGIGMSEEVQKSIFEAFSREKSSTVSGIQGTGLGMAITKKIVDMMGGTITVHSEEGKGSEFVVVLPCRLSSRTIPGTESGGVQDIDAPDFSGKRILLAEDNEMNRMIATTILEEAGLTIEIAVDGVEAVEKMEQAPAGYYDLILMDIQMPRMDGYEAAGKIRAMKDPAKAGIPIVAVTANAFEEDRKIALAAGMNGHLAKPYDIGEIMRTLKEILTRDKGGIQT
ncbi:MAG: transporter substrate-binding domain-containing protein [Stomatobaculum sp.]|nr:transporter substrate-binding domain-containing protein [Stomatobaculum sp.]